MNSRISKLIKKYHVEDLLNGDKAVPDPVARHNKNMSPQRILKYILKKDGEAFPPEIWESVECARPCDPKIDFAGFIRDIRAQAYSRGLTDVPMYGGAIRALSRMMTRRLPGRNQNRLDWITGDMDVMKKGGMLLFIGDLPYYEEIFAKNLGFSPLDTARGAVRLLNAVGIRPVVMKDEVSSGFDELWSGDVDTFKKLAEKNIRAIRKTGAKKIITLDSESLFVLKKEYRCFFKDFKMPVVHITQVLAPKLKKLDFNKIEERAAYHDPCRLGRVFKVFEQPRQILSAVTSNGIVKMKHERENTLCTASHRLSNCGATAKLMQLDVLREAENAGADILVTSCPREAINLKLATMSESWKETNIEIRELISLAAELYEQGQ